jgi:hypothetical protein
MNLVEVGLVLRTAHERARLEACTARLAVIQEQLLLQLVRRNQHTAFGRDHGFARLRTVTDYQRAVPVRDYTKLRPYVERMLSREEGVLTSDRPEMFVTTSGTTGDPKLIPVTAPWRKEQASLTRLWLCYAAQAHPRSFSGRALMVTSPAIEGFTAGGLPYGSMSGVAYQRIPRLVGRRVAIPYAVSLVSEPEARYFLTMRIAAARPVTVIGTPNATTLLRLAEAASENAEAIIRALHDGGLGIATPGFVSTARASETLKELRAWCRPQPARARELEALMKAHGCLRPQDYWPHLALIGCWLGGTAGLHARKLDKWYGAAPLRDLGLFASEGRMTLPTEDDSPAGRLTGHRSFFEFIPEGRLGEESPPILLAHQLELHGRYNLVITGSNGLWRYDMNDLVEVRDFVRDLPKLAFVRKSRDVLSVTGEKVHIDQIQAAIREAEHVTGLEVWQFRLVGDPSRVAHDLLVELRGSASKAQLVTFLRCFDVSLSDVNCEYSSKRKSARLNAPRLYAMRLGWSDRQCREDFRRGRRELQYKWSAICEAWDSSSRDEVVSVTCLDGDTGGG